MSLQVVGCQVSLCLDGLLQGADIDPPAESTARFLELCALGFRRNLEIAQIIPGPPKTNMHPKKGLFQDKIYLPTILIFREHLSFPGSIALLFPLVTFGNTYDVEGCGDVECSGDWRQNDESYLPCHTPFPPRHLSSTKSGGFSRLPTKTASPFTT